MASMIFFDLEGPLSPQDNAFEVMKLFKNGGAVFEALSEYDDILALKNRPGYEPGDTLKLIVPFLKYYGIDEDDIKGVSRKAVLIPGMKDAVKWLKDQGVGVRVISTSYQQHAHTIGELLGVSRNEIACTRLSLKDIELDKKVFRSLESIEKQVVSEGLTEETTRMLDEVYFSNGLFDEMEVEVVGGKRKVDALLRFARRAGEEIKDVIAVGDSITDFKMLKEVSERNGLAVAFNANSYCLPYSDIAIATLDGRAILPLVQEFLSGGKKRAVKVAQALEKDLTSMGEDFRYLLDLDFKPVYSRIFKDKDLKRILEIHKEVRMKVRGEAGKLG